MRIIAGEFRGRKLLPPVSDTTRPITDRAKQSLFDIITPLLTDAIVYDCFAGTGSMGLESLSRSASRAIFFERDRSAVQRLRQNIGILGVEARSRIITLDIFKWIEGSNPGISDAEGAAAVVFLDPPYRLLTRRADDLRSLASALATRHLAADGVIVFRHDARDRLELPGLVRYDQREYGGMMLEFLRRTA